MQSTNISEILTLREACDMLRVHPNTLRKWEREGKIQAIRIGARRDRRFAKETISGIYQGFIGTPVAT